jgi:hypothetical protein
MEPNEVERLTAGVEPKKIDPGTAPFIFAFRPTEMVTVPEEKLAEWEALFAKQVGFQPPPRRSEAGLRDPLPGETISSCGSWDDCDFHG